MTLVAAPTRCRAGSAAALGILHTPHFLFHQMLNPALRALGIPRLRLPSRNWLIFWGVVGVFGGGALYDRYEQKAVRAAAMERVSQRLDETMAVNVVPRKVTVYCAPPPNDFLATLLWYWRHFVKPVLNAGGVDFELFTEERQGDIRAAVAERIRNSRRAQEEEVKTEGPVPLFQASEVIGVNYKVEVPEKTFEGEGGVICIGRGAYKEYMRGLHEGMLGPLDPPESVENAESADAASIAPVAVNTDLSDTPKASLETASLETTSTETTSTETTVEPPTVMVAESTDPEAATKDASIQHSSVDENKDAEDKLPPVAPLYILPSEYAGAPYAPELDPSRLVDSHGRLLLASQPVAVVPIPNIVGFLNTPVRMWRFYTRRYMAEKMCGVAESVVRGEVRPWRASDVDLAMSEQVDWPAKWVRLGEERKSEWTRPVVVDERVVEPLQVYEGSDRF